MKPFRRVSGPAAVLDRADVDTDQIIPKQFLKRIERTGFGDYLFFDWRFEDGGMLRHDFELNDPACAGAKILIAGANFGCGSSREHAPQALRDWGIRAVVGGSFGEIFFGNCTALGIPCLTAEMSDIEWLLHEVVTGTPATDAFDKRLAGSLLYDCVHPSGVTLAYSSRPAAERPPDRGQGLVGELACEVHGDLARPRDRRGAARREQLLDRADKALYAAKSGGRNRVQRYAA